MKFEPFTCFQCEQRLDGLGKQVEGRDPQPGDFALCLHCGCLLVFDATARALRPPWSEERLRFETDPACRAMRDLLEHARATIPGLSGKYPRRN